MKTVSEPKAIMSGNTMFESRYALTYQQMNNLLDEMNDPSKFFDLSKLFAGNPIESIISIHAYPFDVKKISYSRNLEDDTIIVTIKILSTKGCYLGNSPFPLLTIAEDVEIPRKYNNFLDYSPYTKIEVYLPYIGFEELDPALIYGRKISIKYAVDVSTGNCTAFVIAKNSSNDESVILMRDGVIGVSITVGGGIGYEIGSGMMKLLASAAGGVMQMAGTAAVAGVVGNNFPTKRANMLYGYTSINSAGQGLATISDTTVNSISAIQGHVTKGGSSTPATNFYSPQSAYFIFTRPKIVRPDSYNKTIGRPSGKTTFLSQLTGFTVVDSVHVEGDGVSAALSNELDEIEELLKSGVIL